MISQTVVPHFLSSVHTLQTSPGFLVVYTTHHCPVAHTVQGIQGVQGVQITQVIQVVQVVQGTLVAHAAYVVRTVYSINAS